MSNTASLTRLGKDTQIFVFTVWGDHPPYQQASRAVPVPFHLQISPCGNPSHMAPTYISSAEPLDGTVKWGEAA